MKNVKNQKKNAIVINVPTVDLKTLRPMMMVKVILGKLNVRVVVIGGMND